MHSETSIRMFHEMLLVTTPTKRQKLLKCSLIGERMIRCGV